MNWIGSADPNVVASTITLIAAVVASGTALYIARFVYPIQKRKDRELELHGEKRDIYRAFFRTMTTYHSTCLRFSKEGAKDRAQEHYYEVVGPVMDVLLYGENQQAKAAKIYVDAVKKYQRHVFLNKKDRETDWSDIRKDLFRQSLYMRNECLVSFRADLLDQDVDTAKAVIGSYFSSWMHEGVEPG